MPRYTPEEKNQRSLEFEVRILEVILNLTGEAFIFTRYQSSSVIIEIKGLASKRLRSIQKYQTQSKKRAQRDNKIIAGFSKQKK